jgi:hypothetical protein
MPSSLAAAAAGGCTQGFSNTYTNLREAPGQVLLQHTSSSSSRCWRIQVQTSPAQEVTGLPNKQQ